MSFSSTATFGTTSVNPFLINQGGTVVKPAPLSGPPAPPVVPPAPVGPFAPAGTAPAAGVKYANGVSIKKVHDLGAGKFLAECFSNPANKKFWVDLQLSPEGIPANIIANLAYEGTVFSEYDTANTGMYNSNQGGLLNLPLVGNNPPLIMKEFGNSNKWFGYTFDQDALNNALFKKQYTANANVSTVAFGFIQTPPGNNDSPSTLHLSTPGLTRHQKPVATASLPHLCD
jgi:hypothetical protein